jgi:hypothetical protein
MLLNGNQFNNPFPLLSLMSLPIEIKNPRQWQQLRAYKVFYVAILGGNDALEA